MRPSSGSGLVEDEAEAQAGRLQHLCCDGNGAEFQKGATSFLSLQLPPRPVVTWGMKPSGRVAPVKGWSASVQWALQGWGNSQLVGGGGRSGRVTQVPGRCPSDTRAGRVSRWSSSGAFSNSRAHAFVICKVSVCSTVSLLRMWVREIFGEDLRPRGLKVKSEERQVSPAAAECGRVRAEPGLQGGGLGRDPPEGLFSVPPSGSSIRGVAVACQRAHALLSQGAGVLVSMLGQVEGSKPG